MTTLWHAAANRHYDVGEDGPFPYRVMHQQYLSAVATGSHGFTGYTTIFFKQEPELRYGLPPIWRELRFLEHAIAAPAPAEPISTSGLGVVSWLRRDRDHNYVILASTSDAALEVTAHHRLLALADSLQVVGAGRSVAVRDASFSDTLGPGEAHIYTDDPASAQLPSSMSIERDIALRKSAAMDPANLFHASRDVRVYVNGSMSSWHSNRYAYYAINGITDDDGWRASHPDGRSSWIDLVLPRVERIGHVDVFAANLRDFELDLVDADSTHHLASIQGNTDNVVRLRFAAPVPTLRVRLTPLRSRASGGDAPFAIVREIEGFEQPGEGRLVELVTKRAPADRMPVIGRARVTPRVSWHQDFDGPSSGELSSWTHQPGSVSFGRGPDGAATAASASPSGYTVLSRVVPYDASSRYFQVDVASLAPRGYAFLDMRLGNANGSALMTQRPGIFTVDTSVLTGTPGDDGRTTSVRMVLAGSKLETDGSTTPGTRVGFRWMRWIDEPLDGLAVSLADDSPLPKRVGRDLPVLLRVNLSRRASAVIVDVACGVDYSPVSLTGSPYVELHPVGDRAANGWAALVEPSDMRASCDGTIGYPIVFRAIVSGGSIRETATALPVRLE